MALRLAAVAAVVWGAHLGIDLVLRVAPAEAGGLRAGMLAGLLMVYAVLIAVPFVPGIEVGLALMAIEGPGVAPAIYLATVGGLALAYAAGERVPLRQLQRLAAELGLRRAGGFIAAADRMDRDQRLEALRARAPAWLRPVLVRYRYLLIGLLVNLPGNAVIGGGGGILALAGLSRLFRPLPTLLMLLVAVAPVPAAFWLWGDGPGWAAGG